MKTLNIYTVTGEYLNAMARTHWLLSRYYDSWANWWPGW